MAKVLLVEDDVFFQRLFQDELTESGHTVVLATNAAQAINSAKSYKPEIIFLDIMLPGGMNGFDVLRQLKLDQELKDIAVIMVSTLDSEKETALAMGAKEYIIKSKGSVGLIIDLVKKYTIPIP